MGMIKGVVFDFDGVLADSEAAHCRAMLAAVVGSGIHFDMDHYRKRYIGFDDRDAFRAILGDFGFDSEAGDYSHLRGLMTAKQEAFDKIVQEGIPLVPGAFELAQALKDEGTPIAIASGATRADIRGVLEAHGYDDLFELIVTADDVTCSKPDPETYRLAAERLAALHVDHRLTQETLLAIEDTPAGLRSARGAGLRTLGLTTNQPAEDLTDAEVIRPHLKGLSPALLRAEFAGVVS